MPVFLVHKFCLKLQTIHYKAHGALLINALIYGGNYLVAKEILDPGYLTPRALVICRVVIAWILFTPIALSRWKRVDPRDYLRIILCMLFGVVLNQVFFLEGLKLTKPINASLIMTTLPIVVITAAHYLLREKITLSKIIGILLGAIGVILIITYGHTILITGQEIWGDILIFFNACLFGLFLVLVKPLFSRYHPFQVMTIIFGMGSFVLLSISYADLTYTQWKLLPTSIYLAVGYVVVLTTFVTYLMNTYALARVNASIVGTYIYLQPVIATTIALFLGKDSLNLVKAGGAVLIFIGIYLVSGLQGEDQGQNKI